MLSQTMQVPFEWQGEVLVADVQVNFGAGHRVNEEWAVPVTGDVVRVVDAKGNEVK